MTWLLSQGEYLPMILGTVVVTVGICRLLFTPREAFSRLKAQVEDLAIEDRHHMNSIKSAHQRVDTFVQDITARVDRWVEETHTNMVDLFRRVLDRRSRSDREGDTL